MNSIKATFYSLIQAITPRDSASRWAIVLFVVQLLLVYAFFLPNLSEINPWDESVYIHNGQMLVDHGDWPSYAENPLASVFYGIIYLPYQGSVYWLVQSCTLGRLVLFALLWLSTYLVSREFFHLVRFPIVLGMLFVAPFVLSFLRFPSDPLFAAMAGLSFWQLVRFYHQRALCHLMGASVFLGLAAMARNDGLILFPILVVLSMIIAFSLMKDPGQQDTLQEGPAIQGKAAILSKALLAVSVPFIGIVVGYVIFYGLLTGHYELGTMGRTYDNFETGHAVIYSGPGEINPYFETQLEARRVFGTGEENHYSIFAAIRRNPQVYLQRLIAFAKTLPVKTLHAYGIRFAALYFLLASRGIIRLIQGKEYCLLLLLLLWPVHLVSAFAITLVRDGHLLFPFYILLILASVGLEAFLQNWNSRREMLFWIISLFILSIATWKGEKLAIFYGAVVFLGSLILVYLLLKNRTPKMVALMIFLCAGVILLEGYPSPKFRTLGADPREQAVSYLVDEFPPAANIGASAPGPVWMAKMNYMGLVGLDVPKDKNSEEFLQWMKEQQIDAIFVDHTLYNENPWLWDLLQAQIGTGLERVFSADEGDIQILRIP